MKKKLMPWDEGFLPSYSFFKSMAYENNGSPLKAIYKRENPTPTNKDQQFGNVVEDALFLTQDEMHKKYFTIDTSQRPDQTKNMTGSDNKKWKANLIEANAGKECLPLEFWNASLDIAKRVKAQVPHLIEGEFQAKSIGELEGVSYLGYLDNLRQGKFITDVKTCTNAGSKFDSQIKSNFYDVQAVLYMHSEDINMFYWLAIENKPPYDFDVHWMVAGDKMHEKAFYLASKWCKEFKRCQEENAWKQGYSFHTGKGGREADVRRYIPELQNAY